MLPTVLLQLFLKLKCQATLAAIACYPHLSCGLEEKYEVATSMGDISTSILPQSRDIRILEDVLTEVMELFFQIHSYRRR